jgi:hypothetical protein
MITKIVWMALLLTTFVFSDPIENLTNRLSSTHASYNGNALVLEGRVQLDHGLGNMYAEQAFLQKQETSGDFPFSFIELKKDVFLSLKNKSELKSDRAEFDFNELKGLLSAYDDKKVSYKDSLKKEGSAAAAFRLMSRQIHLQLVKNASTSGTSQYEIDSLVAQDDVQIEYDDAFALQADEASYQSCGLIQAYPSSIDSKCNLSYQGESLDAARIEINTESAQIKVQKPNGSIPSQLFGSGEATPLFLSCDELSWDHKQGTLCLNDHVILSEKTLGSLFAEKEVLVQQTTVQNKKSIQSIHIEGASKLEHEDPDSGWKHKISCFGVLHIDGLKGQISLTSPKEQDKQICYQDPGIILHANKALIEYSDADEHKLSQMTLTGNVSIESSVSFGPPRLGLADRLTYNPDTQTVILSALPKKRVLFRDEEQNIAMSAQEVHLTKDPATGKIAAKGIGNVNFSLSNEESNLLKHRFVSLPVEP